MIAHPPLTLRLVVSALCAVGASAGQAQNFAPFTPDSRKLFAPAGEYSTFGIAFDSTTVSGGTTTYHNYRTVQDTMVSTNCAFWTGDQCFRQDRPTWAGARVEASTDGTHTFFNAADEAITFAFSTEQGNPTLLYADDDQQFLLSYVGEAPLSLLGFTENVRQWTILHQDLNGDPISSALNNAPVLVGETVGLAAYFRIDSFPAILEPVALVGQTVPDLGLHTITPAFLHDHQPGDEIQVHDFIDRYDGPPWFDHDLYRKEKVLARTDQSDEVLYEIEVTVYDVDNSTTTVDTITVAYSRSEVVATIPFDRYDGTRPYLGKRTYCGLPLWTYGTFLNDGLAYCPEENCWGWTDTNGPPVTGGDLLVGGLGIYGSTARMTSMTGFDSYTNVVYFVKNGTVCFNEVVMGITPQQANAPAFTLAPNPTEGVVAIATAVPCATVEVYNLQGERVGNWIGTAKGTVDLGPLAQGTYLMRLHFVDGTEATRLVVVTKD